MNALEDLDHFLTFALAPSCGVWPGVELRPVVQAPPPTRVPDGWPECLACDVAISVGPDPRGKFSGLCDACHERATLPERVWYRRQVERWRKWSATRFHSELFTSGPDPWQVTLYALNKAMVGFGTAPGCEGTSRAGLDELLGHSVEELVKMTRGGGLPAVAKAKLVAHGRSWFEAWRDSAERTDAEGAC